MKIVIPGGTGEVGSILAKAFVLRGHDVLILSRGSNQKSSGKLAFSNWDGKNPGDWMKHIDGADIVINLAGRSVNCRYTEENRKDILESRVRSTQLVGEAISNAAKPPQLWLQMSTATIYAHSFDRANDEQSGIIGGAEPDVPKSWGFSIEVAKAWEKAVDDAIVSKNTRKVKLRTSIVMSPGQGGPFDILLRLVRLGLGGQSGNGKQYISWITDIDFVNAILFIVENKNIDDVVNIATPNPLPNAEFMKQLREAWGTSFGLPAAEWMLALGAIPLQSETELILKSRRVVPGKLLGARFQFEYPHWNAAAADLCYRWKQAQAVKTG